MKGYYLKILVFILLIFLSDRLLGLICKNLYNHSNDYTIAKLRYTLDNTNEDILILGSSRAMNQFDPRIISVNTGLSAYNCGFGGQGVKFSYIQLFETVKRYSPKLVILDLSPNILLDKESAQKLNILLPYYKRDTTIYKALTENELTSSIKFLSAIYPYNSTIVSLLRSVNKKFDDPFKGFAPIDRQIDTTGLDLRLNSQYPETTIPLEKFEDIHNIIRLCENYKINLVVVISPVFKSNHNLDQMIDQIIKACSGFEELYCLDYSRNIHFTGRIDLFYDNLHLNSKGSELLSDSLASRINEIIDAKPIKNQIFTSAN